MKSLHAQSASVDLAIYFAGRAPPKMRYEEIEMQKDGLIAAKRTLLTLQYWRAAGKLPAGLIEEIEGL